MGVHTQQICNYEFDFINKNSQIDIVIRANAYRYINIHADIIINTHTSINTHINLHMIMNIYMYKYI